MKNKAGVSKKKIAILLIVIAIAAFLVYSFVYKCKFVFEINNAPDLNRFETMSGFDAIDLIINASDDHGLGYAEFYIDDILYQGCEKTKFNKEGIAICTWNTSSYLEGEHKVSTKVYGRDGGWFVSHLNATVRNDKNPPVINEMMIYPTENGSFDGTNVRGVVAIFAQGYDSESGITKADWFLNDQLIENPSKEGILSLILDTRGLVGQQNIKCLVTDRAGNSNTKTLQFYAQNTGPQIRIVRPAPGEELIGTAYLEVNASSPTGIKNVRWYLDYNGKQAFIGSGSRTYWGCAGIAGNYSISVNVTDNVDNSNIARVMVLIKSPDLVINSTDVSFIPASPKPGENVIINAIIRNQGSAEAKKITVTAYDGSHEIASSTIDRISPAGEERISFNWTNITAVIHKVTVAVDTHLMSDESDENNNYVTTSLRVGNATDYAVLKNHELYEMEKTNLKTKEEWQAFQMKWFELYDWPRKSDEEQKAELAGKIPLEKDGYIWKYYPRLFDIPAEISFEYASTCADMKKSLEAETYEEIMKQEKPGRICPYDGISSMNATMEICPFCGRRLFHSGECEWWL
jgi:hypothetical protein